MTKLGSGNKSVTKILIAATILCLIFAVLLGIVCNEAIKDVKKITKEFREIECINGYVYKNKNGVLIQQYIDSGKPIKCISLKKKSK